MPLCQNSNIFCNCYYRQNQAKKSDAENIRFKSRFGVAVQDIVFPVLEECYMNTGKHQLPDKLTAVNCIMDILIKNISHKKVDDQDIQMLEQLQAHLFNIEKRYFADTARFLNTLYKSRNLGRQEVTVEMAINTATNAVHGHACDMYDFITRGIPYYYRGKFNNTKISPKSLKETPDEIFGNVADLLIEHSNLQNDRTQLPENLRNIDNLMRLFTAKIPPFYFDSNEASILERLEKGLFNLVDLYYTSFNKFINSVGQTKNVNPDEINIEIALNNSIKEIHKYICSISDLQMSGENCNIKVNSNISGKIGSAYEKIVNPYIDQVNLVIEYCNSDNEHIYSPSLLKNIKNIQTMLEVFDKNLPKSKLSTNDVSALKLLTDNLLTMDDRIQTKFPFNKFLQDESSQTLMNVADIYNRHLVDMSPTLLARLNRGKNLDNL